MFEFQNLKKFNNRKIRLINKREIEPQEIFLDQFALKRSEIMGDLDQKLEPPLSYKSLYILLFCCLFLISILFIRSFHLQIIDREKYIALAERNKFRFLSIQASRGVIFDTNFNQLVSNDPQFVLIFDKNKILKEEKEEEIKRIAFSFNLDYQNILKEIENSETDEVVILNDIDHKRLVLLKVKSHDFQSLRIDKRPSRNYVDPEIFSHIIGYTGLISADELSSLGDSYTPKDHIGKSGLEREYEDVLRIRAGKTRIERDALGRPQSEEVISMAESGKSLVLSVDSELQKKMYQELEKLLLNIGSEAGTVVAMDPRTGKIIGMVSYPGFDNNVFSRRNESNLLQKIFEDPRKPLFNRAIAGLYPAGSTIKPLIGLAALQENIVNSVKKFYSAGYLSIPNPWNPLNPTRFADWMPHGWVDLRRAIAVSSNVYFYIIGGGYENQKGLGPELMKKYLELFGWGRKTNIDLPGERDGFIPDSKWKNEFIGTPWRVGDSYNMSIGQGYILVTPLQITNSFVAVANGGKLMRPMLVRKIIDENRNVVRIIDPEIVNQDFVNPIHLNIIREGMRDAVSYGSATALASLPVSSAAKTGTAQIPKPGYFHNWVTVFAPYDNPEIVLTVMVEEVQGIRAAAIPIAQEILQWYFTR